ncbi:hypothetical protein UlMin_041096 [Ulmus minor]
MQISQISFSSPKLQPQFKRRSSYQMAISSDNQNKPPPPPRRPQPLQTTQITCDRLHHSYDICKINGPTVLDSNTSTFFLMDPTGPTQIEKIQPYPRKWEKSVMSRIKELTLLSGPQGPPCQVQHNSPALVFSAGGYTGNFFHEFNEGFIPLYITTYLHFSNRDLVLVISKSRDWWISKYIELLRYTSKHQIIELDNDTSTHCFPSATLGLISHGFLTINPNLTQTRTLTHFRSFLDKAYTQNTNPFVSSRPIRPRLVLLIRTGPVGRVLLNREEVKKEAEKVGFEVVEFEPKPETRLSWAYELINSSHAMVGVHGAGLTHLLFLRPGSIFVQVVPLGVRLVAELCYGKPAKNLGLNYMEYRIKADESSLVEKYGKDDDVVVKESMDFGGESWFSKIMPIYLKEQNIRVDLVRFRVYLKKAYKKSRKFMERVDY